MVTVDRVRISSASTIESNFTWYGIQRNIAGSSGYVFTGNFTSDSVPLNIFDNTTGLTSNNELTASLATVPTVPQMPSFSIQPNLEYNFNPFYLIIPTIRFTGAGASTSTTVPFSLQLTENNIVVTTVNFSLATNLPYSSGIVIPLTYQSLVPASVTSNHYTVSPSSVPTTRTNPAYLRGTQSIGGRLSWTQGVLNLSMIIQINDSSGLGVRIFGTGVTIDPLFTPNSKNISSPITFSPNKPITFPNILTATSAIAINPMSYAITQTTSVVTSHLTSNQATNGTQSFSLLDAFTQYNATINVIAQSSGARGLHARSIFSQPSIFNYQKLLSDSNSNRVVPFVNTNVNSTNLSDQTFTSGNPTSFIAMNVTFTRNVVLNSLDFGYVFPIFLDASNVAIGGYGSDSPSATSTFTITLTSIPRIEGEPSITYGRVQFVCRPNQGTAIRAMHTSTDNQTGANDGTLLSIPFTTTALTTLPTFVDSFTPSVAGSNFTFNIGDQVRIEFAFSQSNSRAIMTLSDARRFLDIVVHQEMCGALVCTPNPPTDNPQPLPPPSNIWFSTNTGEITTPTLTHTLQTETYTFDAPTILHGFRLTAFTLHGVTASMRIRVHVFRTRNNNNTSNIFQVYFDYNNNSISGSAPLFIPFSYAEFDRYAGIAANANDVARINPRSIVFSRPQHPIFNQTDAIHMEISITTIPSGGVPSVLSHQTIVYRGNATNNTIAGRLSGIRLNTPTIAFPTPQMGVGNGAIQAGVTPVFVAFGERNIPISTPITNSSGAFTYTITSQAVTPSTAPAPSVSTISNNAFTAQNATNIHSRFLINAWQRSSTDYTNGLATSIIDYINTSQTVAAYSTSPSVTADNAQNTRFTTSLRPFLAHIVQTSARLHGFSFQFFGGYQEATSPTPSFDYTMRVWVMRGNVRQTHELMITFTTSVGTTNRGLLSGTFAYIPFQQNVIQKPTHVSNIAYTGSLPTVQTGDFVRVSLSGAVGANPTLAGIQSTPLQQTSGADVDGPMLGSLLIDIITPSTAPIQSINNSSNLTTVLQLNSSNIFVANITNATPLVLMYIRMPFIELTNTAFIPTMQSPYRIRVFVIVSDGVTPIYNCEIVICITASVARGQLIGNFLQAIDIPFNMPRPTDPRSADANDGTTYFIESFSPRFNPDYFGINTNIDVGTATHSFPRIFRGPVPSSQSYSYAINIDNLGVADLRVVPMTASIAGAPLGSNVTCQLGYINNLPS